MIAYAVISTLYITGYQHVYSQTQPLSALVLGSSSESAVLDILESEGYAIHEVQAVPAALEAYSVIVITGSFDADGNFEVLRSFVEGGGGLVFSAGAVESLDPAANYEWLGAQTFGYSGIGENVTISTNNPFGLGLVEGDILMTQLPSQSGALGMGNLEGGANALALYTGGSVFAYNFESGGGRVYFQAYADGDSVQESATDLLKSGIIWSTPEPEPVIDVLPPGTQFSTGNERPDDSTSIVYSQGGPQSQDLPVPADPVRSIFVTADLGLVNPVLVFTVDGSEDNYSYHVPADRGVLLSFSEDLNITQVSFEVDDWLDGTGRVGYVTFREVPACSIPGGAMVSNPESIPSDATEAGVTGIPVDSVAIASPPIPVTSVLVGFDQEVNGYSLRFTTPEGQFGCPIQSQVMQVTFNQPTVLSDVAVQSDGPWGLVGYVEDLDGARVFARLSLPQGIALPGGYVMVPNPIVPAQLYRTDFTSDGPSILPVTLPDKRVSALWLEADSGIADQYIYFRSGGNWYYTEINEPGGSLIRFPAITSIDEIYASTGGQPGAVTVGYAYPAALNARAGLDQSVLEEQIVYLDGKKSSGPSGMTFEWTQVEGPEVELRDSNTATPSFGSPEVDEAGARISFRLVITGLDGSQSADSVVITVKNEKVPNNQPPVIGAINGATVNEGSQVVLAASAFDPDSDPLKYSWTQTGGPEQSLSGASTATLSFKAPEVEMNLTLTFQIKVADGLGHATTKDVTVTVIDVPRAAAPNTVGVTLPAFSAGEDQLVLENSQVLLTGEIQGSDTASAAPPSGYDFRWEQIAGVPVELKQTGLMTASFVAPQINEEASKLTFRLGAYGSNGLIVRSDDLSVTVNNSAPVQIEDEGPHGDSSSSSAATFEVKEPAFNAVQRVDAEPPSDIHMLTLQS
ncbi:MAG TPA: hypothetical protein VJP79_12360, partial [Nitrososphaera sp.]|nr:hypothetical protein [Nitrososphaera sp.]